MSPVTLKRARDGLFGLAVLVNASFRVIDYGQVVGRTVTAVMLLVVAVGCRLTWLLNDRLRSQRARRPRPVWQLRLLWLWNLDPSYLDAARPEALERYHGQFQPLPAVPVVMPTVFLDGNGNRIPPPPLHEV